MEIYVVMDTTGPIQAFADFIDAVGHKRWCKEMQPRRKYWIQPMRLNYGQVM